MSVQGWQKVARRDVASSSADSEQLLMDRWFMAEALVVAALTAALVVVLAMAVGATDACSLFYLYVLFLLPILFP